MGKGRPGSGVELRPTHVRVSFTWNGVRCREPLDLKPSEGNRRYAEKLVDRIRRAIEAGTFTEADYVREFPQSERAIAIRNACNAFTSFAHYADQYVKSLGALAPATRSQYGGAAKRWRQRLGSKRMDEIRHSDLAAMIGEIPWKSGKARNNALIPLRGIFDLWVADDRRGRVSPMEGIENARVQHGTPDPFDVDEVDIILTDMRKHYSPLVALYFEFAFFAGMRPEEQIALKWSKIDWRKGTARVDKVRTFKGGERDSTKTFVERDVELGERAIRALQAMRPLTQLKKHGHVFEHPELGKPWHDERSQRDTYWKPSLTRCKVRYRTAYKTRATYVTMNIMAGANPAWVAANSGHSPQQLWKDYAKWINAADRGRERKKLDDELKRRISPQRGEGTG